MVRRDDDDEIGLPDPHKYGDPVVRLRQDFIDFGKTHAALVGQINSISATQIRHEEREKLVLLKVDHVQDQVDKINNRAWWVLTMLMGLVVGVAGFLANFFILEPYKERNRYGLQIEQNQNRNGGESQKPATLRSVPPEYRQTPAEDPPWTRGSDHVRSTGSKGARPASNRFDSP